MIDNNISPSPIIQNNPQMSNINNIGPPQNIQEREPILTEKIIEAKSGSTMLCVTLIIFLVGSIIYSSYVQYLPVYLIAPISALALIFALLFLSGFFTNQPNDARVLSFFGQYYGTVKKNGFLWVNPLTTKRLVSLKVQNLNGQVIKVNDKHGNPVMIGIVVVWRIKDTARAVYEVESPFDYIGTQSEGAVREIGCMFPYDKLTEEDKTTLKDGQQEVNRILVDLLTRRCLHAGIEIIEARITELSYANEIAEVMLKTQAADAVIAARDKIVNGAVSMIGHALKSLGNNELCEMTREKKAKLVSNMLVILCGESQNNGPATSNSGTGIKASAPRLQENFRNNNIFRNLSNSQNMSPAFIKLMTRINAYYK